MSRRVERLSSSEDLDGVLAIEDASFNNPTSRAWYEEELKRPEVCFIYVLRTPEHRVAAFCALWLIVDQAHINNLAVLPELRGRGLGGELLRAVIAQSAQLGAVEVTLEVRASNTPALQLYRSAGFTQEAVRKNYYSKPIEDALVLRFMLHSGS